MADINKFTTKEVLNKVLLDSSGDAVVGFSHTTQEALNAVLDTSNNRLNISIAGGTISGDVTIGGDLTVSGDSVANVSETITGSMQVTGTDRSSFNKTSSATNSTSGALALRHVTDANMLDNFGASLDFQIEDSGGSTSTIAKVAGVRDGADIQGALTFQTAGAGGTNTERMRINVLGRVGIGTDSPSTKLHVASGAIRLDSSQQLQLGGSATHIDGDSGYMAIDVASGTRFKLDTNSRISLSNNDAGVQNTIFGKGAGLDVTDGAYFNALFGEDAGANITTGDLNTAMGYRSSFYNVTGSNNTAIGYSSLQGASGQSHSDNTAIGYSSLYAVTTGGSNVAVGAYSGDSITEGNNNVTLGVYAGANLTTQDEMTFVGHQAGINVNNDNSDGMVAIGYQAGFSATINQQYSTFVGKQAGHGVLDSEKSTMIGNYTGALLGGDTADNNTFVGVSAGASGSYTANDNTANNNVGIGTSALGGQAGAGSAYNFTASHNVAIGNDALKVTTTGASNVAIGSTALDALTTGVENHAIGRSALGSTTTQGRNIALGYFTGSSITGANSEYNVFIGDYSGTGGSGHLKRSVAIGYQTLMATAGNDVDGTVSVGYHALKSVTSGDFNTALGAYAGDAITTDQNVVAIGYNAYSSNDVSADAEGGSGHGSGNIAIGYQSMQTFDHVDFLRNTAVGFQTMSAGTSDVAQDNTSLGYRSLQLVTTGDKNTGIGSYALKSNTTGYNNVAVGAHAGDALTIGHSNVAIGESALGSEVVGYAITAVGFGVFSSANHDASQGSAQIVSNTGVGYIAGASTTTGHTNTFIGAYSAFGNTSGARNVALGYSAFYTPDIANDCVSIGNESMSGCATNQAYSGVIAVGKDAVKGSASTTTGINGTVGIGMDALTAITTGTKNTAIGYQSGMALTDCNNNTLLGYETLMTADSGEANNVVVGASAGKLINNSSSANNVIMGFEAGSGGTGAMAGCVVIGRDAMKTTGSNAQTGTIAIGYESLTALTSGAANTAIGFESGKSLTTGTNNTAIGYRALDADAEGDYNTCIGSGAGGGFNNTGNDHNTCVGYNAGTGGNNQDIDGIVAIGSEALTNIDNNGADGSVAVGRSALAALTSGTHNTVVGYQSGDALTIGGSNTLMGYQAGGAMVEDRNCVAIGREALLNANGGGSDGSATDTNNTAVGAFSGDLITIGTGNTLLGSNTDVDANNRSGCIIIGSGLTLNTASNNVVEIGNNTNSMTYDLDGGDITVTSDVRTKKNIKDTKLGLEFINKLRPITYQTKSTSQYPKEFKVEKPSKKSSGKTWDGLIAQEVKKVMDDMDVGFSGWEEGINTKQRLAYGKFVMPLIKAVQELSAKVEELESKLSK